MKRHALALATTLSLAALAGGDDVELDADAVGGLDVRSIGPAAMGGRIAALDGFEGEPSAHLPLGVGPQRPIQGMRLLLYVGAAGGGVWKSSDGGITFKPVFDKHTQSIGAIRIDRANPETVWVGAGESWTRNSVSIGDGVYKTTDGGDSWQRMGLEGSERIARIVIDPKSSDTVYVCATGHLWDSHPERGVFKTTNGGKSWEKALFVNDDTGCADIAIDPQDSRVLYAAMWQFRRKPYFFTSGGPGSGLYKSTDAGATWRPIRKGLPPGELGRIAVAVAGSRPSVVYAVVEAKKTALYRSDDLGESWTELNSSFNVVGRPFYFAHLVVDPANYERVYKPGFSLTVSDDGGKTFSSPFVGSFGGGVHGDHHALWINPKDPDELYLGTDGGVYASTDRGTHWRFLAALPVSQFYHVSYDLNHPYNVYGGLQDNGSWFGPSQGPGGGPIGNRHWRVLGGGDGFWAFVDPNDPDIAYVEYQGGNLLRVRKSTGETKEIKPFPGEGDPELRFNWNTPFHLSPTRPGVIYYGSQFLYRSTDRGDSWERISPDLTTNNPEKQKQKQSGGLTIDNSTAENHCTIFAISESPRNPNLVWAGTDDGNLQVTRDGGKTWANVESLPGLPRETWVTGIEPSRFDEGAAYAVFDGHATGDMKSYVYRTADFGKTWESIATPDVRGYAHVIREDLVNPNLLFVGTELGLFTSVDRGKTWAQITGGLPNVAVRDLAIHPREHDLIIATHGRGIYILDDLTPLRNLTSKVLDSDVAFLESRPAVLDIPSGEQRFDGDAEFQGRSREESAFITYYLKRRHIFGDLKIEVYGAEGKLISTLPGGKRRGVNRVMWPMRLPAPKVPPAANLIPQFFSLVGPRLPAGTYTVKMVKGKDTYTSQVKLVPDARSTHSAEERALQQKTVLELYDLLGSLTYASDAMSGLRDQAKSRAEKLKKGDALERRLSSLADKVDELRRSLVSTEEGLVSGDEKLREKLGALYGAVNGYEGKPTASQVAYASVLKKELQGAVSRFDALTKDLGSLNTALGEKKIEPLAVATREEWTKKQEAR